MLLTGILVNDTIHQESALPITTLTLAADDVLLAVADGVATSAASRRASRTVLEELAKAVREHPEEVAAMVNDWQETLVEKRVTYTLEEKIPIHPRPLTKITPEEYLTRERQSETKNEYFNGKVFAMAGASREHNQISVNLVRVLGNQLLEKPCSVYSSDMKVKIEKVIKYTYPDIVIACQPERFEDANRDVLLNPVIIMEILSDSTEAYDRGRKFLHYQLIDSLVDYILISQDSACIETFSCRDNHTWLYAEFHRLDAVVNIESISCTLRLSDVYHKVDLPALLG